MVGDICSITREQYICQALKTLPQGPLWERDGRRLITLFRCIASVFYDDLMRDCEKARNCNPCTATGDCALEWAECFGFDARCVDSITPAAYACEVIKTKKRLDCQRVTELALAEGYIVQDCRMCDETTEEVITPLICGGDNPGGSLQCPRETPVEQCTKYDGLPCADTLKALCCDGGVVVVEPETDPCAIGQNTGGCACTPTTFAFSPAVYGEPYSPLATPFCLVVTIDPASPSGAPPASIYTDPGASLPAADCDFAICSIESALPLGYSVKYVRGC